MKLAVNFTDELEVISCANCSMSFGAPSSLVLRRRKDHATFYCPHGHSNVFRGESDVERYKRLAEQRELELASERETNARQTRQLTRERNKAARLKKRIANGVCPCCRRTVKQMARHMATKHPDYQTQEVGA